MEELEGEKEGETEQKRWQEEEELKREGRVEMEP